MLQIKCPHCQKAMAMNAMPPSGRVACTQCGQLLVLQAPVKQAPRPAAPQPPMRNHVVVLVGSFFFFFFTLRGGSACTGIARATCPD